MALKQYHAIAPVGSNSQNTSIQVAPNAPNRTYLFIQNTGANPGLLQFRNTIQNDGSDILLGAGDIYLADHVFSDNTFNGPTEAINLGSQLGTTFAILEGIRRP